MDTLTSLGKSAARAAVYDTVNSVLVLLNPSISYTSNSRGSFYIKNYIAYDADTEHIPYEFVNVKTQAPDVAVLTTAAICAYNSVKLYKPSVRSVTKPEPPVAYFNC